MRMDRTDFQDDLMAWFDDEIVSMTTERVMDILDLIRIISLLPNFVKFMTVEELLQVINDISC